MPISSVEPSGIGLRRIALLQGLSAQRLDALARECAWRNFTAGQHIISRDANDRNVYFVVSGLVRVTSYSKAGRQVTFHDLEQGDFLGEMAAIDGMPRSADVIALESSLVASMTPAVFTGLLRSEPAVAARVLERLASLVRGPTERHRSQHPGRAELHPRRAAPGAQAASGNQVISILRLADIASQVSTYREQVTRELSALAKAGLLEKDQRRLVVRDVRALEALVYQVRGTV
jgi:CRP-like cAMP-binding protein